MNVSQLEWIITLGATIAVLVFDVMIIGRRPHKPSMRECAIYLAIYVGLAVAFGVFVWWFHGNQFGLEFFAGWLTEEEGALVPHIRGRAFITGRTTLYFEPADVFRGGIPAS